MSDNRTSSKLQSIVSVEFNGQCDFTRSEILPGQDLESGDPSQILEACVYLPASAAVWKTIELLKDALKAWLSYRADREVEVRHGVSTVRIKGVADVDFAIEKLRAMSTSEGEE